MKFYFVGIKMLGLSRIGFRKDYNKNQAKWITRIANVNKNFRDYFCLHHNTLSLADIYTFLGNERNKIAKELEQGLLDRYGVLRKRDKPGREFFLEEDAIIAKEKVKRVIDKLYYKAGDSSESISEIDFAKSSVYFQENKNQRGVDFAEQTNATPSFLIAEGLKFYAQRLPEKVQQKPVLNPEHGTTVIDAVKSCDKGNLIKIKLFAKDLSDLSDQEKPVGMPESIILSHLFLFSNSKTDFRTAILIYGSISLIDSAQHSTDQLLIKICQAYIAKASNEKDAEKCKSYIGKILFLLAHMMPIKRGNASAVEVLINAIAEKAGHTFCLRLNDDELNWDIEALFSSHTMSDYLKWFHSHCDTLSPDAAKVIKTLKNCEAQLAKLISENPNKKLSEDLTLTQQFMASLMSDNRGNPHMYATFKNIISPYKMEDKLTTTNNLLLSLGFSLYPGILLEDITVGMLVKKLYTIFINDNLINTLTTQKNLIINTQQHPNLLVEHFKSRLLQSCSYNQRFLISKENYKTNRQDKNTSQALIALP